MLFRSYTSSDGGTVTRQDRTSVVTPAGTFRVATVMVRYPQTIGSDAVALLESAQRQINDDHASFAKARGYSAPIVVFNNTNFVIDASQVVNARSILGVGVSLSQLGRSASDFDFVVSINIDPGQSEGGFSAVGPTPAFIYMGNFSQWHAALSAADFTSVAGAVYHHEVIHHWGWPGTHDWQTCGGSFGFNFRVPPMLLGWEDVDGDGVPEILDPTPYGRAHR